MIETDSSAVISWLVCQVGPVMAINCILVARRFFKIEVIVNVRSVSIALDHQGKLVVDGTFDDLRPAVFQADHVLIQLLDKVRVEIFHLGLAAIDKAAWY